MRQSIEAVGVIMSQKYQEKAKYKGAWNAI